MLAGDDHGDLAAFDALDELIALGEIDDAVRVGVHSDEAPPELLAARADIVVDGPEALVGLLDDLVVEIRETSSAWSMRSANHSDGSATAAS